MKIFLKAAAAGVIMCAAPAMAQRDFSQVEIKTTEVAEGIYMLEGAGGNIGLSVGEDGAFVIDDQFAPLSEKILAAIAEVTDKPVEFVLNTHHHGDHTGGNEAFGATGAHIVAHDNVRKRMASGGRTDFGETPPAPEAALPVVTFSHTATFHWNGDEIFVFHPGSAHTDGDAIIHFKNANVLHMGDILFAGQFPFIDLHGGGGIDGFIAALEKTAAIADENVRIIPGHGPLSTKADLEASIAMLKDVRTRIQAQIDAGQSEDEAAQADPLGDLKEPWGTGFIDAERMTRIVYRSLKADG